MEKLKKAIESFVQGGDNNDVTLLEEVLHPNYQNVQDGFFERQGIFVFSKEQYIDLVRTKKFGGSPRTLHYGDIRQMGNMAMARVTLKSERLTFDSTITCVFEKDRWQVIGNLPTIVGAP